MKGTFFALLLVVLLLPFAAESSRPVDRTLTGCVVENTFYSVYPNGAYQIRVSPALDLRQYEGKTVRMSGWLSPGDRFTLKQGTSPEVIKNSCDADSMKVINKVYITKFSINAMKAAEKADFAFALAEIAKAVDLDRTECNTYIFRAQIEAMKNDFAAVARDMSMLKSKLCSQPQKRNYLLLEDLGRLLEKQGRREQALDVYRVALEACLSSGSGLCKESIEKNMRNLGN